MIGTRRHVRHLINPPLYVAMNGASAGGILYDVSPGGLSLDVVGAQPIGGNVLLNFDMVETGDHFEAPGRIVWQDDATPRIGIQFSNLPEASHLKIRNWISAKSAMGGATPNVTVQDGVFMEFPSWLTEPNPNPASTKIGLEPTRKPLPLPDRRLASQLAESLSSHAATALTEDEKAAQNLRTMFSDAIPLKPEMEVPPSRSRIQIDWPYVARWLLAGSVLLLVMLALVAAIKISTTPSGELNVAVQTLKWSVVNGWDKLMRSSDSSTSATPRIPYEAAKPEKTTRVMGRKVGSPSGSGVRSDESPPADDRFAITDAQHGRRYLPRTSTNLMVQFEKYSPGDTGTTFVTRTPPQTGSDGTAKVQNNATEPARPSARSNNSVVGSGETGANSGVSRRYDGPVYLIQGNTKIDGRISRDDETPISGRVTRESSGEIPVSETIPEYPRFALRANMQGRVVLTAIIAKDGSLEDVRVLSSPSPLDGTVLEAVKTWRYQPHVENGKAVEAVTEIIVDFTITTKERRTGPEG